MVMITTDHPFSWAVPRDRSGESVWYEAMDREDSNRYLPRVLPGRRCLGSHDSFNTTTHLAEVARYFGAQRGAYVSVISEWPEKIENVGATSIP